MHNRIASIDILRALTMVLMIFVNDLWSLNGIPAWLEHVEAGVDGIGLADTVFPAFLFIVGLSIPFAIEARRKKGDDDRALVKHALLRTLALVVMGLWLVNGEYINERVTGMWRGIWNVFCCTSFLLIWNAYSPTRNPKWVKLFRYLGIFILFFLAVIYRGGDNGTLFEKHWWGILGLIGWSYLPAAIVAIYARERIYIIAAAWVFLSLLSMAFHAKMVPSFLNFIPHSILGGTEAGLTMGGLLCATVFRHFMQKGDNRRLAFIFLSFSGLLMVLSVMTRPYWGLAKLGATPAWLFLCSAFTLLAFLMIYFLVDVYGKASWFSIIKPAGTDTLLTYFIPYYAYTFMRIFDLHLPEFALVGGVGLMKSLLFALLCVGITRILSKIGISLKI